MNKTINNILQNFFIEKEIKNLNVNDNELLRLHRKIVKKKPMLKSAFLYFYNEMIKATADISSKGIEIELGSGAGFFKDINKNVMTSDIRNSNEFDLALNALDMQFKSNSVRAIYGINVFHHLPNPKLFIEECNRTLVSGGRVVLIEPHNGFLSSFIHKSLHKEEYYDPDGDWINTNISGPLSGANQALNHIVFCRDIEKFKKIFHKKIIIKEKKYMCNWLRYLFSGGVNFKQTLPTFCIPILILIEKIFSSFSKHLSLHQMIVLEKIS